MELFPNKSQKEFETKVSTEESPGEGIHQNFCNEKCSE